MQILIRIPTLYIVHGTWYNLNSYFVLGTLYLVLDTSDLLLFLMSNTERPVQNVEVGNPTYRTISYFVSRISYFVHCTWYFVQW
jgi:hypothetical protein